MLLEKPSKQGKFCFNACKRVSDLYCIVDRADWIELLAPSGITVIQLRIKNYDPKRVEQEITQAIQSAERHNIALYINDYWALAIKQGAYGVHLGQDDLLTADLQQIAQSGLRLGISTHNEEELAQALAIQPTYVALGPIYKTTSKIMPCAPQGLAKVKRWRDLVGELPLVVIGGIKRQHIKALVKEGADSVAMISHILSDPNPLGSACACMEEFQ